MNVTSLARRALLVVQATVAVTAFAGGTALVLGSVDPSLSSILTPPQGYLDGSPFSSYLIPGVMLAVVLGGIHLAAFLMLLRRSPLGLIASAVAGFAALIWIFVQMIYIPFSFLQAVYFTAGVAETGLVMVALGLFAGAMSDASAKAPARMARG